MGLIIGSVLGTFALAAFLVVAYVSYEDDAPVDRPSLVLNGAHLSMRFCELDPALNPERAREAIDAELRRRGYVSAGEWVDDQEIGVASGEALDGGCGLVVAHARIGSHFRGVKEGSIELRSCRDDVVAIATCGTDVEFLGTGVASLRPYVMPGVSDDEVARGEHDEEVLSPTHRLLQGEAEHVLGRFRLVPVPRVYLNTIPPTGTLSLPAPDGDCEHYVVSVAGEGLLSPSPELSENVLFARTLCAGDAPIVINAGGTSASLAAVRYETAPGIGVASRVAAQINDAEIVTDMEDLQP